MTHVPAWLRILVAGWPAVAFLGGTLLAHSAPTPLDQAADTAKDNEVQADEPALPPTQPAHLPVEQAPHQQPATEQEPPETPALSIPAALVAHARKVAAEHHTRTGTPIDTPTLRARLGVPAPMAEAIATHL
jgi:hypothetical protein